MASECPALLALLFCEFDAHLGPELVHQVPNGFYSKERFSNVKKYIITKPELCSRTVAINAHGHQIIGHPIDVPGAQYARNHLLFNVAFIISGSAEAAPFRPLVRKVAECLRTMELESAYVSTREAHGQLPHIFSQILFGLTQHGQCDVPVNSANAIRLRLLGTPAPLTPIKSYMVPVILDPELARACAEVDLAIDHVLSFIDGVRYLRRIAEEAQMDVALAERCLQCLKQCGVVALVEAIQFSNVYVITEEIPRLAEDAALQQECLEYVRLAGDPLPDATVVLGMYFDLVPKEPALTLQGFCDKHQPTTQGVDVQRFIHFGRIRNLIRQVKTYPLREPDAPIDPDSHPLFVQVLTLLDGRHSTDEICCLLGVSGKDLGDILDSDPYTFSFQR